MQQDKINPLIQWWHGWGLPAIYIFPPAENRPRELIKLVRLYWRTWIIHPLKRRVAKYYLAYLQTFCSLKVIAITGSAGKTTTKEFLASILSLSGKTVSTHLNIDSTFSIPAAILKCTPSTKYLVLEMGVEYTGDMDFYQWLVKPNIAIITNIYQTHTLYLNNIEGVKKEKIKIINNLGLSDFVILNKENNFLKSLAESLNSTVIWFGDNTNFSAKNIKFDFKGSNFSVDICGKARKIFIPLIGRHFITNALAAIACSRALNITANIISAGLKNTPLTDQRLKVKRLNNGAVILDDSYNNNPQAAIETFKAVKELKKGKKLIVVYSEMKELGSNEAHLHEKVGQELDKIGAELVILVGKLSKFTQLSLKQTKSILVEKSDDVLDILKPQATKESLILFKGARSHKLEQVIAGLA